MTNMDLMALTQLTGASAGSSVAASMPVDSRSLLTEIAASTTLSNTDKAGLIAAVAQMDSALSGSVRSNIMSQVQGLGIYLRNTGSEGYPRWPMMTALRAYGLNLTDGGGQDAQVVVKTLQSHLEQIAQGHNVSLSKAIAAATTLGAEAKAAPIEVKIPAPAPAVKTTKVDTLA